MDVNEKSIDLVVVKPDKVKFIKIDISQAKYVRDRYFRKRRSIQRKTLGKTEAKLLAKYSGREKRRVNDVLHKASKIIAHIIAEENCGFQADRHLVAAWNIAVKLPVCRPLPLAAKALDEPLLITVRGRNENL